MKRILILWTISLALLGCAKPKVDLVYTAKPRAGIEGIRKITVLPFKSNTLDGDTVASEIESDLILTDLHGKPYFHLIPVENLMIDYDLDRAKLIEIGRREGLDGILYGHADGWVEVSYYTEKRRRCVRWEEKGIFDRCLKYQTYWVSCQRMVATFRISPKLISVKEGKVVYSRNIEKVKRAAACSDVPRKQISAVQIMSQAKEEAYREILMDIAPHVVREEILFIDDPEGVAEVKIFEEAIQEAKNGRPDRSCSLFRKIRSKTYAVLYNLGLCAEMEGRLKEALKFYRSSLNLKRDERTRRSINRVRSRMD